MNQLDDCDDLAKAVEQLCRTAGVKVSKESHTDLRKTAYDYECVIDSAEVKPNNLQFGFAQFCIGALYSKTR